MPQLKLLLWSRDLIFHRASRGPFTKTAIPICPPSALGTFVRSTLALTDPSLEKRMKKSASNFETGFFKAAFAGQVAKSHRASFSILAVVCPFLWPEKNLIAKF